jgi:CheY-like chemotaxis protein
MDLSERAASLTRQMLAFARKPALAPRPLMLGDLVRATAELVTRTLHAAIELEIEDRANDAGELFVVADSNQLQQALVNLTLNARDASPADAPITYRLRQVVLSGARAAFPENVPAGDYVLLEVHDRGSGMTQEVLNQALDPFFTTKPVGRGTGLGLPMVFGIVRGHQGYLTIETESGRGTVMGIYLRRLKDPARSWEPVGFDGGQVVEPEAVSGRNILVVDDEEAVRDVICRFLEIAGHRVTCVACSTEATRLLANGSPADLIILDLLMPQEDGLRAFRLLREQRPRLPILLCTGLLNANPDPEMLTTGPVSLVRKPFRMNELWYAVNQALNPDCIMAEPA